MAERIIEITFGPQGSHTSGPNIASATTLAKPNHSATKILMQAFTQNVRFTLDGTTPTASVGFQLKAGDPPIIIPVSGRSVLRVIEEASTAVLNYQWGS